MKILFALLLTTAIALSAEPPAQPEYYQANEVSLDLFGQVRTDDFDDERMGAGVGINYFLTRNWGIGIEGSAENTSGVFVEAARANMIYRIPIGKSAPYVFAGAGANFCVPPESVSAINPGEADEGGDKWAIDIGVGIEHRFGKHFGAFADVRLDKVEDRGATALARLGIRIPF